ncbi:translation initiation factor eIF3 subunit [Ceratobasidium sp. AG-I]|nr:translation initiation factor eIF3 subunit [Ceratobasidium sp. AG-I]
MGEDNWDESGSDTPAAPAPRAPPAPVPRAKPSKWADEDEEEKPASDWDASSDDEKAKATPATTNTTAPKKKKTFKAVMAEKEAAAAANARRGAAGELDPDEWRTGDNDDEPTGLSVAEQRARELESDLKNTGDLLGAAALGDAPSELTELVTFNPRTKEDFQKLSNMIVEHVIQRHQAKPLYASFIELHTRALAEPLRDVDVRKVASGLSTLANEKQKEQREKASGKKKPKAAQKPGLGLAKAGTKVDTNTYEEALDDFGNDDFM